MLAELDREESLFHGNDLLGVVDVGALGCGGGWDHGVPVWPVVHFAFGDSLAVLAITMIVHNGTDWTIDGYLLPVHAEAGELRIEV